MSKEEKIKDKNSRKTKEKNVNNKNESKEEDVKVRLRRTQSVAKAENITEGERKVRRYQIDKPCHEVRDSLFSWSSGFDRYEGFVTWGALILVLGGTRLFLENVLKYGIRIDPRDWISFLYKENKNDYFVAPTFIVLSNFHYIFTLLMEILMSKNIISGKVGISVHIFHLITMIFIPVAAFKIWGKSISLLGRMFICCVYTVGFVKLWSYIQVNHWCRQEVHSFKPYHRRSHSFRKYSAIEFDDHDIPKENESEKGMTYDPVIYPDNLTVADLYYFLAAPTLCYELNFPRSLRIRKRFLLRRMLELFILFNILLGLFQQWIIPSVKNSFKPFAEMNYMKCTERILKLAIPNHLLWLIWFYSFFHSFLNMMGELLRFGDRNFYQDWWNARDVGTFWRLWNMPVHRWCVRHLFVPIIKLKFSKWTASMSVFLVSAFFHEYFVSVPLNMYKIHVFMGMLVQVPLVKISSVLANHLGDRAGNVVVWASLIIGQPVGIMVYFHDYIVKNFDPESLGL